MTDQNKLGQSMKELHEELDLLQAEKIKLPEDSIAIYKIIVDSQEKTIKILLDGMERAMGNELALLA